MTDLAAHVAGSLDRAVDSQVRAFARELAREAGACGVLFYGSNLRTGSLDGVLDFYVLMPGPSRERIWPRISYREWPGEAQMLRAKIATLPLATFAEAAAGRTRDTTIWTRFVQPSALAFVRDDAAYLDIAQAVAGAAMTAARIAAALGPVSGPPRAFWQGLFRQTYLAEFRVEKAGREDTILANDPAHFEGLLAAAWTAQGLPYERQGEQLAPRLTAQERAALVGQWRAWRRLGKPLNILRLAKAAGTFEGAADYAAWKVARHTGIALAVTPYRRRHPVLAMPGAAWELWRARRRSPGDQR